MTSRESFYPQLSENFQKILYIYFSSSKYTWKMLLITVCVFSYLYHQLVLYTHFCASPQNRLFGITSSGYRRHSNSILAYSPQERLLPCPQEMWLCYSYQSVQQFALGSFFLDPPYFTVWCTTYLQVSLLRTSPHTPPLSRMLPLYTELVQNTLLKIFSFQCSWSGNKSYIVPLDLTYILYHIFWCLSSTFMKFLKNINFTCMHFLPFCLTIHILYHKGLNLSTPCIKFFTRLNKLNQLMKTLDAVYTRHLSSQ